jgi:hypothetical protein
MSWIWIRVRSGRGHGESPDGARVGAGVHGVGRGAGGWDGQRFQPMLGSPPTESHFVVGPERAACLGLWLHALTWCWYLHTHRTGRTWIPRPWYTRKTTPSFLDALAALRRTLWSQRITAMSAHPEHADLNTATVRSTESGVSGRR